MKNLETLRWIGGADGHLRLIDQTLLPLEFTEIDCRTVEAVWEAIRSLRVRGAPAIGIAAAYGVCVGLQTAAADDEAAFFRRLDEVCRLPGRQPAHRGEPLLGPGPHEGGGRQTPRPAAGGNRRRAAGRGPGHP